MNVAFLGPEATFTHQAALRWFGPRAEYVPCRAVEDVFREAEEGRADAGVVPVENSTEGSVNRTLDMFLASDLRIGGEIQLHIRHCLLARRGRISSVRAVHSHPQALAQCRRWVSENLPSARVVEAVSTAEAARLAAGTPGAAAIASALAARLYGLKVLAKSIEGSSGNVTRFLVVGSERPRRTGRDKTSLLISIKDRVGALHDMLVPFRRQGISLSKIESRPTGQKAWEYVFFVDIQGHRDDARVRKALAQLERRAASVKILGSYRRAGSAG